MPVTTIPLIGTYNTRPGITFLSSIKDLRITAGYADSISDNSLKELSPYLVKRAGFSINSTIVSSKSGRAISYSADGRLCFIFSDGSVYFESSVGSTAINVGSIVLVSFFCYITPAYLNNETYFLISDSGTNGCYYLPTSAAQIVTPTFTANTNSNTTLSNVSSFSGLFVGQLLSGTNIQAGSRIASMDSGASTITMTLAATGTTAGITVTFSRLAKIISANFPSSVSGGFAFMDGYAFIMSSTGSIYNSNVNDPATWKADNFIRGIQATSLNGGGQGVAKIRDRIIGLYSGSYEYYYNAGNASGSILSRITSQVSQIGLYNYSSFGDYLFAIGAPSGEQLCNAYLFTYEGMKEVTTPQVARDISQGSGIATSFCTGGRIGGYDAFFIQATSTSLSIMYRVQDGQWYQTGWADKYFLSGGLFGNGGLFGIKTTDSVLYQISSTTFQDGGVAFSMILQTKNYSLNKGLPFQIDNISLTADTQSSGSTLLESSADDYASFGTIGSFDLTQQQKNLSCGGYYDTTVAFKLTDPGNNAWRGQALQITWRPAA